MSACAAASVMYCLLNGIRFCLISSFFAIIWRHVSSGSPPRSSTVPAGTVHHVRQRRLTLSRKISGVVVPKGGLSSAIFCSKKGVRPNEGLSERKVERVFFGIKQRRRVCGVVVLVERFEVFFCGELTSAVRLRRDLLYNGVVDVARCSRRTPGGSARWLPTTGQPAWDHQTRSGAGLTS